MDADPHFALLDAPRLTRQIYGARSPSSGQEDGRAQLKTKPSAVELQVLVALSDNPDQGHEDIAQRLALEPSTVRHALRQLEGRKLIEGSPHPGDRRRRQLKLTPAGKRITGELTARAREMLAALPARRS